LTRTRPGTWDTALAPKRGGGGVFPNPEEGRPVAVPEEESVFLFSEGGEMGLESRVAARKGNAGNGAVARGALAPWGKAYGVRSRSPRSGRRERILSPD